MQRTALREFEEFINNPECFKRLCDDLLIYNNFPSALPYLDTLIEKFSNASLPADDDGEMACYMGTLKRRQPEMLTYLAREWHEPNSQLDNTAFVEYARSVSDGSERPFHLTLIADN